jgi:hypothetical protein
LTSHRSINRRYATLARELGLDVTIQAPIGWSATSVPEPTAGCYARQLEELQTALVLWRRLETPATAGTRSRNLLACRCPCGRKLRAARTTLAEAPILAAPARNPSNQKDRKIDAYQPVAERTRLDASASELVL